MSKFKFVKISKSKKIRCLLANKYSKFFVVFLHGFMSDLEGSKPKAFSKFCINNQIGFLGLEYSGHGKSYGKFENGTITSWTEDAKKIIKKKLIIKN